ALAGRVRGPYWRRRRRGARTEAGQTAAVAARTWAAVAVRRTGAVLDPHPALPAAGGGIGVADEGPLAHAMPAALVDGDRLLAHPAARHLLDRVGVARPQVNALGEEAHL